MQRCLKNTNASLTTSCFPVRHVQVQELRHWIEYHALLGVGKVYVYDESPISMAGSLEDLTTSGLVEYEQLSSPIGQLAIYAKCLEAPRRERHQ